MESKECPNAMMIITIGICNQKVPLSQLLGVVGKRNVRGGGRRRKPPFVLEGHADGTPNYKNDHHYGGDLHNPQRLAARFMHAFDVHPPEIDCGYDCDSGREEIDVYVITGDGSLIKAPKYWPALTPLIGQVRM